MRISKIWNQVKEKLRGHENTILDAFHTQEQRFKRFRGQIFAQTQLLGKCGASVSCSTETQLMTQVSISRENVQLQKKKEN